MVDSVFVWFVVCCVCCWFEFRWVGRLKKKLVLQCQLDLKKFGVRKVWGQGVVGVGIVLKLGGWFSMCQFSLFLFESLFVVLVVQLYFRLFLCMIGYMMVVVWFVMFCSGIGLNMCEFFELLIVWLLFIMKQVLVGMVNLGWLGIILVWFEVVCVVRLFCVFQYFCCCQQLVVQFVLSLVLLR